MDASQIATLGDALEDWDDQTVAEMWAEAQPARSHFYVHVPFCKSICHFCNYERLRPSRPQLLEDYTARVEQALSHLVPALSKHTFHSLYLGGGTPSVLSTAHLDRLMTALDGLTMHWRAGRFFEGDPANLSPDKIGRLTAAGIDHFSFGVQTLNAQVNLAHDRGAQGRERVGACFDAIAQHKARASCDFLSGLAGTTVDGLLHDIEETLETWRPAWIDVYELTPTPSYVEGHFADIDAFWEHLQPFQRSLAPGLVKLASKHGYQLVDGRSHRWQLQRHEAAPFLPRIAYTQSSMEDRKPVNLLGIGPSARGKLWAKARTIGTESGFKGRRLTIRHEALEYLVLQLRDDDRVEGRLFVKLFGGTVEELFPKAIAAWTSLGVWKANALVPQTRQVRMETLLWLVDEGDIEWELARVFNIDLSARALGALGFEARRQHIRVDGQWLRVRPPLQESGGVRLLVPDRRDVFASAAKTLAELSRPDRRERP